jgi:two-component system CheB/CheR fusion protein
MPKRPGGKSKRSRTNRARAPAPGPAHLVPDHAEQQLSADFDNIVPSRGYGLTPIVGLGGSAGSIAAMREFFSGMPPDSGMAFVVVLHLSAEHESILSSLIQRTTSMPVAQVVTKARVEPNRVYVIPPGKSLVSADGFLQLDDLAEERGRRMTVDIFFRTLADSHGPHAAAIVLSGADGDGAIGIKRIKERGGLTVVQDPEEAEYPGMPQTAIATGMIDWVLRVGDMPARLVEYGAFEKKLRLPAEEGPHPAAPPPPPSSRDADEAVLRDVLAVLRTRTGRDFSYYKRATILRRVARRMQVNSVEDLHAYLAFLRTHAGEASALLQDLLISVTNFFRDHDAFASLAAHLPKILESKTSDDIVRVWVPACATGEEAYSIAMLLAEHSRNLDSPPLIQVFATDLHDDVIQAARHGLYHDTIAADVSEERLRRFFTRDHHGYRVRREIREAVMFASHDLLKDSPFSRIDLISCRNLLIYLDRAAQARAFDIFKFSLNTGGLLFLGLSESADESASFSALDKKHRIYLHRGTQKPGLPVLPGPTSLALALRASPIRHPLVLPGPSFRMRDETPAQSIPDIPSTHSWAGVHAMLVDWLAPPSILVNGEHEIVHLSEKAGQYLKMTGGEPSRNLLHLIHPDLRIDLRASLYRADQTKGPAEARSIPIDIEGTRRTVDIRVIPAYELSDGFMLVTLDAQLSPFAGRSGETATVEPDPASKHLENQLERVQGQLRDTIEQHEASTEELKASNEELQAMNEELRSATEELETSREELQSINEELTTVNQELKSNVDELAHANSDLHNLMASTAIATIFLDRDLRITRYTPTAIELFSLIPTDVGRPLTDLTHRLDYAGLERDAHRVLENLVPIEREVGRAGGRWFLVRLLPYRTMDDRIAGVVLTFVDVSDLRNTREALTTSENRYLDLFNSIDEAVAILEMIDGAGGKTDFRYLQVNPAFAQQAGLSHVVGKTVGETLPDLEPVWTRHFRQAAQSGEQVRFEARIPSLERWFDVFVSRIGGPGSIRIGVMFTDVTARRNAQDQLARTKDDLEQRVTERTRDLSAANRRMLTEVSERIRLEEARAKLLLDFATAQEDERNRVARDLHDSLGQHLVALTMGLKTAELAEGCSPEVRGRMLQMQGIARRLDEEIDRLSHALRPLALSDLGLEAALRRHLEEWSRETGIAVDAQITILGPERFSFITETTIYRVVQEALTNVAKHAEASRVSLIAERRANDLRVIVEDNGRGFDTRSPHDAKRLGLRGMRERAALVGGELQIESSSGRGTTVFLTVPLMTRGDNLSMPRGGGGGLG